MLYSIDINTLTGSILKKEKILALQYTVYDGITCRAPISNIEIETVGSVGQARCTYQALV